jgi:hypothetical protein
MAEFPPHLTGSRIRPEMEDVFAARAALAVLIIVWYLSGNTAVPHMNCFDAAEAIWPLPMRQ